MSLPRPYTSYNLFSQLEREYILQALLGVTPTVSNGELFDPNDHPDMPPLPPRYDGLVLPWDWHLPGKTQRRKRKHRKSHGKIGFHELNQRISRAWSAADDDVRKFCTVLSEIEGRKYKKMKREEKRKQCKNKAIKTKESTKEEVNSGFDFDWMVNDIDDFPGDDFNLPLASNSGHCFAESTSSTKYSRIVSFNDGDEIFSSAIGNGVSCDQVDMSDDEIMNVWRLTRAETETPAVEIPLFSTSLENTGGKSKGRESFIDAEFERFVKLGKEFKATKRRLPLLTRPRRLTISAAQA